MGFGQILMEAIKSAGNPVVAGIDPRSESLPSGFLDGFEPSPKGRAEAFHTFGKEIIDVVAGLVPAVKFQAAFYEALGPVGMAALEDSLAYAKARGLVAILDGKRNDIGSTAEAYAQAYLGQMEIGGRTVTPWDSDALTINPYLGSDGILPFAETARERDRGLFVLVRTSNPSAGDIQDLVAGDKPIYRHVAELLARWAAPYRDDSGYSLMAAVVGATYPEQLAELREALPGVFFLVPGYGAQGGAAKDVAAAFDTAGMGAVVNNSRGLTFAYLRKDLAARFGANWQGAVEAATREMIEDLAANTPAGRLRE